MESSTKYKLCIASASVVAGCTVSYLLIKHKRGVRDAAEVFNYLNIKTVTSEETCDQVVRELRRKCQEYRALGLDCEWVTDKGKRQPVALVQLSSFDGLCGLFRLNCMKTVPQSLKNLLEDKSIYKVGVAVTDDSRYLTQDYGISLESTLDLRYLSDAAGCEVGGLALLAKTVLGVILDKSWRVRCSNWEAEELSERQSQYAAVDAHVAIRIFSNLVTHLHGQDVTFPWLHRFHKRWCWDTIDKYCTRLRGINYKMKSTAKVKPDTNGRNIKVNKEALALSKRYPNATRTKPLYDNCFLQAPDGEQLCTCDQKKALWYVQKELADVVSEQPFTVRLRFEPAGRSVGDVGRYYQLSKENKCVVCGNTNSYIRKNIVPREYRKYFPEIMKDHSSHDVVLLCSECHRLSNVRDQAVREQLSADCSAPLPSHDHTKFTEDITTKKIKSAARALLYQSRKHVLPDTRRAALEELLLQHYPDSGELTQELLEDAANIHFKHENLDFESHGEKVVEHFLKREGLLQLEKVWRQHFLDTMRPQYMPALWSINHTEERMRVKWDEGRLHPADLRSMGFMKWLEGKEDCASTADVRQDTSAIDCEEVCLTKLDEDT